MSLKIPILIPSCYLPLDSEALSGMALRDYELDASPGGAGGSSSESRQALEGLCKAYWYPRYAFVRRQGYDAEESRDLTQAYFAKLLEKGYPKDFDPSLGRFRVFLKASVKTPRRARAW